MNTKKLLQELEIIHTKQNELRIDMQYLIQEIFFLNLDMDFNEVLKAIAKISPLQAIKLHYDYLGGTLMESKQTVDKLLKG